MSKVLVTGASGFIGRSLVARLGTEGHVVIPLDSATGDIASAGTIAKFAHENISHIYHLAGRTYVPDSWVEPLEFSRVNVSGTINILEFCRQKNIPLTFVSAYVYGRPDKLPVEESGTIRPSNPYALTKRLAEEACEFYADAHGLSVTIVRPFNVYGIGQSKTFLIPSLLAQALGNGEEIFVNDLAPRRDYVYLEDLVTALLATLGKAAAGCSTYNIGSGKSLSVQEVIDVIQQEAGTQKRIVCREESRPNELMDVVADISKVWRELGWCPTISFHAGVENIIRSERLGMRNE